MLGKWIILHTILAFGIVAAVFNGKLAALMEFDHMYALPFIGGLIFGGSLMAAWKQWEVVDWLAERLPAVGLLFTVLGVVYTVAPLMGQELSSMAGAVMTGAIGSMVGTFMGVAGWLWLGLVRRVCHA